MSPLTVSAWSWPAAPSHSMSPLTLLHTIRSTRDSWPRRCTSPLTVSTRSVSTQPSHSTSPLVERTSSCWHWGSRPQRSPLAVWTVSWPRGTSPLTSTSPAAVDTRMKSHQRRGRSRVTSAAYSPRRNRKKELAVRLSCRMVSTPSSVRKASSRPTSPPITTSPSSPWFRRMVTSPATCTSSPVSLFAQTGPSSGTGSGASPSQRPPAQAETVLSTASLAFRKAWPTFSLASRASSSVDTPRLSSARSLASFSALLALPSAPLTISSTFLSSSSICPPSPWPGRATGSGRDSSG